VPLLSHSSLFDYPGNIWWGVQVTELLIVQSSPLLCYLLRLMPKYLPRHPVLKHPQAMFSLSVRKFHAHTKQYEDNINCCF
jgi:hypothetical protein